MTQAAHDKRSNRRYPMAVPVVVRWEGAEGREVSGVLRDVNDHGIFFYVEANIPVGANVELTFTVPRELTAPETFRFIGTLVRTEDSLSSEKGFAIAVSRSELLDVPQTTGQPLEALEVGKVVARVPETCWEEGSATQPRQHLQHKQFRSMSFLAGILAVSVLVLAFAAKGIMARQQIARSAASAEQNIRVWVDPSTGLYHCPGSGWYGKGSGGKYVTQKEAQLDGFHPAYRRPCEVASSLRVR